MKDAGGWWMMNNGLEKFWKVDDGWGRLNNAWSFHSPSPTSVSHCQDLIEVFPGKPTYDNQQFVRLDPSSSATYLLQSVTKWTRNSRHGMWWTKPRTENKTSPYKGKTLKAIASIDFLNIVRIAIAVQWLKCFEGGEGVIFDPKIICSVFLV